MLHKEIEDPFQYLLAQKISTMHNPSNKYHHIIRLNLHKLPNDFFQPQNQHQLHSQRTNPHYNQFLAYNRTVELKRSHQPQGFSRHLSKESVSRKRQLTAPNGKRPEQRRFTECLQEPEGFNCTFAKKMFSQSSQTKKKSVQKKRLQFPSLQSSRLVQKLKLETVM